MTKRLIIIVTILFSVITTAQERTSSPYSFYGLGLTTFRGTVENKSMGGLSIYTDSIHMNLQNPAAYGRLRLTTYAIGGGYTTVDMESETQSGNARNASLDYLAIGIPAGKFGFGFGLLPYTSVGYNVFDDREDEGTAGRFSGKGGVNKVFLSAGYQFNENISVGIDGNYNFGNIQNRNLLIQEGVQYGSREINRSDFSGFSFTVGLDYERMLNDELEMKFGAYYSPEISLNSQNERELATVVFGPMGNDIPTDIRNVDVADSELTLPSSFTIGAGIGNPLSWFLGAEYSHAGASEFSNRSFSIEGATYEPSAKYKVGGFFIPNYNSLTSYMSRIVYRGGVRMEETGLHLDGEAINEFGISFGVGLPVGGLLSNVNLGFEYGQRGTTNAGLVKENFFNATLGLSLNDRWFMQRKFE